MELFEVISKRHSYRGPFKEMTVPREDLKTIVQAGLQAPSGCNEQTTTFVIVDDQAVVTQIGRLHQKNVAMQQARAIIACIVDRAPAPVYEGFQFQAEDCAAAVENMLLAITALGYASVWIDGWLRLEERAAKINSLLGLPAEKTVRVLLPIGLPVEIRQQREKKPLQERCWFNSYGKTD
jgi:nitroreductase